MCQCRECKAGICKCAKCGDKECKYPMIDVCRWELLRKEEEKKKAG